jgi:hypothetical protein
MYIGRRMRDAAGIEALDARSNARDCSGASDGSIRFDVYNSPIDTNADSRRDRAHRHRHAHQ